MTSDSSINNLFQQIQQLELQILTKLSSINTFNCM